MQLGIEEKKRAYHVVTGANGGLGFAICCRLLDEYLATRASDQPITLVFTTRSVSKGQETSQRIWNHLKGNAQSLPRVTLQPETLDLTILDSVKSFAERLRGSVPRIDAIILNAGAGGFTGINWPMAVWSVLTNPVQSLTWPTFKKAGVGYLTRRQVTDRTGTEAFSMGDESPVGEVFCANVLGHYMLIRSLGRELLNSIQGPASTRVIWISSLEALADTFDISDIQALQSSLAYESSKRLTDVLALTSCLHSTRPWVNGFFEIEDGGPRSQAPRMLLSHPGICSTAIVPLHLILFYAMTVAFYLARWIGSPWHTVLPYSGASAPVWLALMSEEQLAAAEMEGKAKWGSATDLWGNDRVSRTEVEGWGLNGIVGDDAPVRKRRGRKSGAKDCTAADREDFEVLGRECWKQMEAIRAEWEQRLAAC